MKHYRPLRLVLFIYDFIRLILMTGLLVLFIQPASLQGGGVFPQVFYLVPNGLFPLMSFFLWVNLKAYKPFISLYMTGKILAVVSVFAWLMFSLPLISSSFLEGRRSTLVVAGAVLLLSAGDALSVLGGAALKKHIYFNDSYLETEVSEQPYFHAALPREPGKPRSTNPGQVPEEGN